MDIKNNEILNPDEVSQWLRIPKTTLYKLCNQGQIPCTKIGRHWRFDRALVEKWFKERAAGRQKVIAHKDPAHH